MLLEEMTGFKKLSEKWRTDMTIKQYGKGDETNNPNNETLIIGSNTPPPDGSDHALRARMATRIQSAYRGHLARKKTGPLIMAKTMMERRAATKIQSAFRIYSQRKAIQLGQAALKIQAAYRGFTFRKERPGNAFLQNYVESIHQERARSYEQLSTLKEHVADLQAKHLLEAFQARELSLLLGDASDSFSEYCSELDKDLNAMLRNEVAFREMDLNYDILVSKLGRSLAEIFNKVAYPKIIEGVCFKMGSGWTSELSHYARKLLSAYDAIFVPYSYEMLSMDQAEGDEVVLTTAIGEQRTYESRDLSEENPAICASVIRKSDSYYKKMHACELLVPLTGYYSGKVLRFNGYFKPDVLDLPASLPKQAEAKHRKFKAAVKRFTAQAEFKEVYAAQYGLKNILLKTEKQWREDLNAAKKKSAEYCRANIASNLSTILAQELPEQVEMLSLLVLGGRVREAHLLLLTIEKGEREYGVIIRRNLHPKLLKKLHDAELSIEQMRQKIKDVNIEDIPYEEQIYSSAMPELAKVKALEMLSKANQSSFGGGGEGAKAQAWLDALLRYPWGKEAPFPVSGEDDSQKVAKYMRNVRHVLDDEVLGHHEAKETIEGIIGEWISKGSHTGDVICLQGPPGNGKTTFCKALAKALDRPFEMISCGGSNDGSDYRGHNYTYVGAKHGKLVGAMMRMQNENGIIFFDEVDKISQSEKGKEVAGILTHLLDPSQNDAFEDDYFDGVKFDFSKVLFVLSCNDPKNINEVLRDRMKMIETHALTLSGKQEIVQNFFLPQLLDNVCLQKASQEDAIKGTEAYCGDITISKEVVSYLVNHYAIEPGARRLRQCLETIVRKVNLARLKDPSLSFPIDISKEDCDEYIVGEQDQNNVVIPKAFPVLGEAKPQAVTDFMNKMRATLDEKIVGNSDCKDHIERIVGEWVSKGSHSGGILCLQGARGTGKTTFCKAIADALERPYEVISYRTSAEKNEDTIPNQLVEQYGEFIGKLLRMQNNNGIVFLDGLDELALTKKGQEVLKTLEHIIDPEQPSFVKGVKFDFSKMLFMSSCQKPETAGALIYEKMKIISMDAPTRTEKVEIILDHVLAKVTKDLNFEEGAISFSEEALKYLINHYTFEEGVSGLAALVKRLVREVNVKRLKDPSLALPYPITEEACELLLKTKGRKLDRLSGEARVGTIYGLWVSAGGTSLGGVSEINVVRTDNSKDLQTTGNLVNMTEESMRTARTVAMNLLPDQVKEDFRSSKDKCLHIGFGDEGSKKDGPSAGAVTTSVMLSAIANVKLRGDTCVTGTIRLDGKVGAVGGIHGKLIGAMTAGAKRAIIPKDCEEQLIKARERDPEVRDFDVRLVDNINEVLDLLVVQDEDHPIEFKPCEYGMLAKKD